LQQKCPLTGDKAEPQEEINEMSNEKEDRSKKDEPNQRKTRHNSRK